MTLLNAWAASVILNWIAIVAWLEPTNRKAGVHRSLRQRACSYVGALTGLVYSIFIIGQFYGSISTAVYLRDVFVTTKHCPVCRACHEHAHQEEPT